LGTLKTGDKISIYFDELQLPAQVTWTAFGEGINLGDLITSAGGELRHLPKIFHLARNYPNPFNPETTIKYQLPKPGYVSLNIYNLLGQRVRTLVDDEKPAGYYQIIWDGRDDRGVLVSSGIYLYELRASDFQKTRKMLILK